MTIEITTIQKNNGKYNFIVSKISTRNRAEDEVKKILGDGGSMQTRCLELKCFLCDIMETKLKVLRPLYPILAEICSCFYLQKYMAAVTLTNHFLESIVKFALIYKEGNGKTLEDPKTMDKVFETECRMYLKANLGNNIETLYKKGMITEVQCNHLKDLKDLYRNAYSHASNNDVVANARMKVVCGSLSNPDQIEEVDTKVCNLPLLLVIARKSFVKNTGLGYFYEVVKLLEQLDSQLYQLYKNHK